MKTKEVRVTYELTKEEVEDLIRAHFHAPKLAPITWDVPSNRKVRSVSIVVTQTEVVESPFTRIDHV